MQCKKQQHDDVCQALLLYATPLTLCQSSKNETSAHTKRRCGASCSAATTLLRMVDTSCAKYSSNVASQPCSRASYTNHTNKRKI